MRKKDLLHGKKLLAGLLAVTMSFGLIGAVPEQTAYAAKSASGLVYFVDCGDFNPETVPEGETLGIWQGEKTDQIYDSNAAGNGKKWGVTATNTDTVEIVGTDSNDSNLDNHVAEGSKAVFTKYQWANQRLRKDEAITESFRYARDQSEKPVYVKYQFDVEPGEYQITVGMGNSWNNAGNPDIYAGLTGNSKSDQKLNSDPMNIPGNQHKDATGTVEVTGESAVLHVYALSQDPTIQMNYIRIVKVAENAVASLSIKTQPTKTTYYVGEELDTAGLELVKTYKDNTQASVAVSDCRLEGFDSSKAGTKTVTVSYTEEGITVNTEFSVTVQKRPIATSTDTTLAYFVDCGDFDPETTSEGDAVSRFQSVTDKIYGPDKSGKSWGVVTSDDGEEPISVPADTDAGRAGSLGVYTTYQWAHERQINDTSKEISFRYAHDQKVEEKYIKYRFEVEPGEYQVTVGMGNCWLGAGEQEGAENNKGNAGNPHVYAGSTGSKETDTQLSEEGFVVPYAGNREAGGTVTVPKGSSRLDVYALSQAPTIQMNYIEVVKKPKAEEMVTSLEITKEPTKKEYFVGDKLELAGMELQAVYANGTKKPVEISSCTLSDSECKKAGTLAVTVSYREGGKTVQAEFTVTVKKAPITTSEDPNLIYFVDCGDFNPDTASSGDAVGKSQSVTDKIYGPDESGKSWGVVTSDDGEESISVPADTAAGRAGSLGVYTTYQWAHERQTADTAKEESFRYAHEQGSFESRYVKYRFDLEPGRYLVTVGVGNSWGNAANPDIYAGTAGDPEKDAKLNPEPLNIPELGHETVQKKVAVPQGKNSLDVYVLSKEATLQVNYIRIEKAPEGEETLTKLKIKKTPKKLIYQFNEAQELNTEGLSVAAVYSDGYEELLSLDDCTITGFSGNTPGTQTITVSYTKGDVTVKAVFEIKVEEQQGENPGPGVTKTLTGLRIKTMPAKTVYQLNETLNTEGMTVAAVYSDNSEEPVQLTDCTITGFSGDKAGTQTITVTYTKGGITVNADFQIEVKTSGGGQEPVDPEQPVKPVSLTIQPPTKKEYQLGEQLNLEGMVLTLTFSDETTSTITAEDCTVAGFDSETAGEKTIKITYKDKNNVSVSGEFKVTVLVPESAKLESLIIDSKPNKTQYKLNEAKELNTEGMEVTAVYSGGIKKVLQAKDYQVTGFAGNKLGEQIITVTYTEKDITVQAVFKITVVPAEQTGAVVPASLKVTSPKKTEYLIGEKLVLDGMILTVKYSDGTEKKVEAKDCVISGFDSSKEGTRDVVVSYTEKEVTVTDFFAVKIVKSPAAPKTYRVFYHDNKGGKVSGMPSDTNAYVVNAAAVVKGNPVSTSKFFAGWNTQANGKGKSYAAGSRITINGEVHLYAQWKASYTAKDKLKYKVTGKQAVSCVGTANKKASSIKIPDSVKYNGITYKVTSIGSKAFYKNAKLKTVKIGNQVTKIGASAFASNKKLASVTIGKGMKSIESKAFYKDAKLKKVSIKSSKLKTVKKSAFKGVYKKAKISVPKKKAKAYKKLLKKAGLPSKASVK